MSSATLLPIPVELNHGHNRDTTPPLTNEEIPALQFCAFESASKEGVYGWGPSSGPAGCKLFIFLRHTSPLAVKLLSIVHAPSMETRFWIDFDGRKVPAAPHKFYFNEIDYPLNDVNITGLGRDREILLALVPASTRRRVPIWLYVVGDRGMVEHNVQLGYFHYDEKSISEICRADR